MVNNLPSGKEKSLAEPNILREQPHMNSATLYGSKNAGYTYISRSNKGVCNRV